ncbi:hypothetical protein EV363DRAFT_1453459 [Boletus edulis]|nr:hypothetical protein EV363DRAFT_1453459 [Boletus edulis]
MISDDTTSQLQALESDLDMESAVTAAKDSRSCLSSVLKDGTGSLPYVACTIHTHHEKLKAMEESSKIKSKYHKKKTVKLELEHNMKIAELEEVQHTTLWSETNEAAVIEHKNQIAKVIQQHESDHKALQAQMDKNMQATINKHSNKVAQLQRMIQQLESEREIHEAQIDTDQQATVIKHKNKIVELEKAIQQHESIDQDQQAAVIAYKNKIVELEDVIQQHKCKKTALWAQIDKDQQATAIKHKKRIAELEQVIWQHKCDHKMLQAQMDEDKQAANIEYQNNIAELRRAIQQLESQHEVENNYLKLQINNMQQAATTQQTAEMERFCNEMKADMDA